MSLSWQRRSQGGLIQAPGGQAACVCVQGGIETAEPHESLLLLALGSVSARRTQLKEACPREAGGRLAPTNALLPNPDGCLETP